jgi:hypothetical protein
MDHARQPFLLAFISKISEPRHSIGRYAQYLYWYLLVIHRVGLAVETTVSQ